MKLSFVGASLLAIFLFFGTARATELTDLGSGLSYLRVHVLADSAKGLTTAVREQNFIILDLRHATTTAETTEQLRVAFMARESKPPALILVGPATPAAIGATLTLVAGKCVVLGIKDSIPLPQVIIEQSADSDLRAYEALDAGQLMASLISGKIDKDRFDEAALMKEFNSGNTNTALPAVTTVERPASPNPAAKQVIPQKLPSSAKPVAGITEPPAAGAVEPLTDRVLQRAVHLHRALIALRR